MQVGKEIKVYGSGGSPLEHELMRACFQVDEDLRREAVTEVISGVNWERFQALTRRNSGTPWAMHVLTRDFAHYLPPEWPRQWRHRFRLHVAYCIRMVGMLHKLEKEFDADGIPVATFKGPVLGQAAYGDFGLRAYQDLDVMIREADFQAAYTLLTDTAGFVPIRPMTEKELIAWARGGREFVFSREGKLLDLHMRLTEGPSRFGSEFILPSSLIAIELMSQQVPAFNAEAHFVLLSLHGAKHGWPEMSMVGDAAFLAHNAGLDMDELGRLTGNYRCCRAVDLALLMAHDMCGLKVENYLTGAKEPSAGVLRAGRDVAARLQTGNWTPDKSERLRMMLGLLDSLPARAGFVWYTATAPKLTDLKEHGRRYPYLLRLLRPFRMIRRRMRTKRN